MITKEEYIAARDLVEAYHKQLQETIGKCDHHHRLTLRAFRDEVEMSERLANAIKILVARFGDMRLDQIRRADLLNMPGIGIKTAEEFTQKQQRFLQSPRPE